jgi:mannose-1-phosphate guanylyltransferase
MRYATIMAGGSGTRLWPMSRADRPKQLLEFIRRAGEKRARSLLELAANRLEGLVPLERRAICTGEAYRGAIRAGLPAYGDEQILGEPIGRDTVNAVGFAAAVFQKKDPDAVFAVLTADHLIDPQEVFRERMELGFRLVENDPRRLVTFSIKPTYAATGFGYVERGTAIHGVEGCVTPQGQPLAFKVARFVEKPNLQRAQAYVESGMFGWNAGMFILHAGTFLECLKRFKPESHEGMMKIQGAWGTERQREVLDAVYPGLPKISVDYAVMEPAAQGKMGGPGSAAGEKPVTVCTVLMDVQWLDVGSWPSFAQTLEPDKDGNRTAGEGTALIVKGKNNLVVSGRGHTVAVLGAEDLIVVHTPDATLVMPRAKAEELKELHGIVGEELK